MLDKFKDLFSKVTSEIKGAKVTGDYKGLALKASKSKIGIGVICSLVVFIIVGCNGSIKQNEMDKLNSQLKLKVSELESRVSIKDTEIYKVETLSKKEIDDMKTSLENIRKETDTFFALDAEERELAKQYMIELKDKSDEEKKIEQERIKAEQEAKEKAEAEAKAKAEAKAEAEEKARKEAEEQARLEAERNKYNTGLTYEDLARNPIDNALKLVTFKGKIIQVMKGNGYTQYRMAIDSDYDKVVLIEVQSNLLTNGNILEDDIVTIRGKFVMEQTYTTVMGDTRTIPAIVVDEVNY